MRKLRFVEFKRLRNACISVGPGRSAVHGVSFACVFTYNLHALVRNACILRGSRKERGAQGLFCMCFYVQFAHVVTK